MQANEHASHPFFRRAGLWLGPALFFLVLLSPVPASLPPGARRAAATAAWMAAWWITEAVPLAAASLLPLALFPPLSVLSMEETARRYADPNVYLFMGGFFLALAMQKAGLHRRIALSVIAVLGEGPRRTLAGFMLATAVLSMWVSNTATALMVLPIGLALLARLDARGGAPPGFAAALMLGIAYAASIGGVATLIGSPPNMIFAGQARTLVPDARPVGFLEWTLWAAPMALGFLAIVWWVLARPFGKADGEGGGEAVRAELAALPPLSVAEKRVMTVFFATVAAWVFRADLSLGAFTLPGWTSLFGLRGVDDATVAMAAAAALFALRDGTPRRGPLLDWEWARKLPWEVLLLFGGGFALAQGFQASGFAAWLAERSEALRGLHPVVTVVVVCSVCTFLSEMMSNTAQVTLLMPVLAALAPTLGVHPYLLMIPATAASSFAFMLPVGTPPNAIVFASGQVTIARMARTGFALNLLGVLWITLVTFVLVRPLLLAR